MKGYVQVYTGNGKGKTTAAFGLALRSAGAGLKVFIAQFVKGMKYSELESIGWLSDKITLHQYGRNCFIRRNPTEEDIALARDGLDRTRRAILSGDWDVVILDEANIAVYFELFPVEELLTLIEEKPEHVELIITGRYADERLIERADLVTEMREVKHYYVDGVKARAGIEK
uniref:Corrinoid adenosyltransferase n=1 Tax=Candidatus Kentrum sp. FW TaxID=2126338 RepID=A0A450TRN4_9GAMM|nr:MAG: cob(I)yrinic acid a,c-diamide adenosyltransferase [Candidatus Kentron sp. FW]